MWKKITVYLLVLISLIIIIPSVTPVDYTNVNRSSSVYPSVSGVDSTQPIPINDRQLCTLSNGKKIVVWRNGSGINNNILISTSTDDGDTWSLTYPEPSNFYDRISFDCNGTTAVIGLKETQNLKVVYTYDGTNWANISIANAFGPSAPGVYADGQIAVRVLSNNYTYILTQNATRNNLIFNSSNVGTVNFSMVHLITDDTQDGGSFYSSEDTMRLVVLGSGGDSDRIYLIGINDSDEIVMWNNTGNKAGYQRNLLYTNPVIDIGDSFWCNGHGSTIFCTGTDYGTSSVGYYCMYDLGAYASSPVAEDCSTSGWCISGALDASNSYDISTGDKYFLGACTNSTLYGQLILAKYNGSWQTEINLSGVYNESSGQDRFYMPHAQMFTYDNYVEWIVTDDDTKNFTYGAWHTGATTVSLTSSLISPTNNYYSPTTSVDFTCTATSGVFLKNLTVWHNASGTWAQNKTIAIGTQSTNQSTFNISFADGEYIWNCLAWDNSSAYDWGNTNYTIMIDTTFPRARNESPTPINGTRRINNTEIINISYYDLNFQTCLLEWNNANETFDNNNSLYYWETKTTTDGGNYTFRAFCNDSAGNVNITTLFQFTENTKPVLASAFINISNASIVDSLNCSLGSLTDAEWDSVSITYEWYNASTAKGINNSVLAPTNLSVADIWYCSAVPWDGYENGTIQYSATVGVNSSFSAPVLNWTNATTTTTNINSTATNPTNNNSWINITIQLYDNDASETWYVYMCNTTNFASCKAGNYLCNGTLASTGAFGCRYNLTGLPNKVYTYYPQIEDSHAFSTGSSISNTFEVNHPPREANLSRPVNSTYFNVNYTLLNYTGYDPDGDTLNYSVYISTDISNLDLAYFNSSTTYNYTNLSDGIYYWAVWANDQHRYYSLSNSTVNNFTIDTINPFVNITDPSIPISTSIANISVTINSSDVNIKICSYDVLYRDTSSVYISNTTYSCNSSFNIEFVIYSGGYLLRAFSNDSATNIGYDDVNITINTASGGGGGGGKRISVEKTVEIRENITAENISKLCGNNNCEENIGETPWTCSQDCFGQIWELDQIFCKPFPNCGNWNKLWFTNLLIIALPIGIIYLQHRAKKAGRKL